MNNILANKMGVRRPAVFFDRDGTLIDDIGYLADPAGVHFYPGIPEALRKLQDRGFVIVVVTNQSGIGRGFFDEETALAVNLSTFKILEADGVRLDAIYYCPHHPDEHCLCRKPGTLMVQRAMQDLDVDASRSWLVGDVDKDIRAGKRAGFKQILVETGKAEKGDVSGDVRRVRSVVEAVEHILVEEKRS